MLMNITETMRNEWRARCIADVVPALADVPWESQSVIAVDDCTAREIERDCAFYIDPKAVDATAVERAAYRALKRQIDAALTRE
jgi:hypothetical protein